MNNSRCARWKSAARVGLASLALAAAPARADDAGAAAAFSPLGFSAVYSHTVNQLDRSQFPVTEKNGFARRADALSVSVDGDVDGWVWRARLLLSRDGERASGREWRIKELNKVWSLSERCQVSAGKRILAWDVGFLSQPVGFFQTQTVLSDLVDVAGNSEGLPLLLFSCGIGNGMALDLVRSDDFEDHSDQRNSGLHQSVVRLSGQAGGASYALLARRVNGQGQGVGATFSTTLGKQFELHASLYSHKGGATLLHRGVLEQPARFWSERPYVRLRRDGYSSQALLGLTWTPRELPVFTLEWAHDDAGLGSAQWRRWTELVRHHQGAVPVGAPAGVRTGNLLWDLETIQQRGTRRDYAYLQMQGSLAGLGYSVGNEFALNDGGNATFASVRKDFSRSVYGALSVSHFSAGKGSEFAYVPNRNTVTLRIASSF